MTYEYFEFKLETSPSLPGLFWITNPPTYKYCTITKTGSDLFIITTGIQLNISNVQEYLNELQNCGAAIHYFNEILNSK